MWGIYECAYRFADIDDLIMNTAGTFAGAIIAPVALFWMPRADALVATRSVARRITSLRRYASMLITAGLVIGGNVIGLVLMRMGLLVFDQNLDSTLAVNLERLVGILSVIMFIYLPALRGYGNIGMLVVWLAPRWRDESGLQGPGSFALRLLRASVTGLPYLVLEIWDWAPISVLMWFAVGLSVVTVPFSRTHRAFSGMITGATLVDTRALQDVHLPSRQGVTVRDRGGVLRPLD